MLEKKFDDSEFEFMGKLCLEFETQTFFFNATSLVKNRFDCNGIRNQGIHARSSSSK